MSACSKRARFGSAVMTGIGVSLLLLGVTAWGWQPAPSKTVAERIKRDVALCKRTKNLETCDDAVRWSPSDPTLLVAFGDALMRANHPADALRQYQRAAALAPKLSGVGAKISAAEVRIPSKHPPLHARNPVPVPAPAKPVVKASVARSVPSTAVTSFSNDAADSHSH